MKKTYVEYNPQIHEPLGRHDECIQYWLDIGKKLRVDENYRVYFGRKWVANCRPKRKNGYK